ncbi:MAG: hypothetical protein J6F30_02335 [Cellulosilyticum sp.]|nr:hypothetical protein [Cellulosilyticum sp.]
MYCKNCTATYPSDSPYCTYCGSDNPEFKNRPKLTEKEISTLKTNSFRHGVNTTFRRITLVLCSLFAVILIAFGGITYYYVHQEEWRKESAVSGKNYEKNLALINQSLDQKDYLRAYMIAYSTSPTYELAESYPDVAEELRMLECYVPFISDVQAYIAQNFNFEYLYLSSYFLQPIHELYVTTPSSPRAETLKNDLCKSIDLYLKYYYYLSDEEIQTLKDTPSFYDYTIEGTTEFGHIIEERICAHEKSIQ